MNRSPENKSYVGATTSNFASRTIAACFTRPRSACACRASWHYHHGSFSEIGGDNLLEGTGLVQPPILGGLGDGSPQLTVRRLRRHTPVAQNTTFPHSLSRHWRPFHISQTASHRLKSPALCGEGSVVLIPGGYSDVVLRYVTHVKLGYEQKKSRQHGRTTF